MYHVPKAFKVLKELEDLGFTYSPDDVIYGSCSVWLSGLEKARSELSDEEFSTSAYERTKFLISRFWDILLERV